MNIGPQSGGFLPILKVKSRIHSSKQQKRNRSATARSLDSMTKSAGKISTANTASLLDLTTLTSSAAIPETKHRSSGVRLQRENSLPLNLSLQISPTSTIQMPTAASSPAIPPVLKYSHDKSGTENVLSKLDALESPRSSAEGVEGDATPGPELNSKKLPNQNTESNARKPHPPPRHSAADNVPKCSYADRNSESKVTQQELATNKKPLLAAEQNNLKWKLDVTLPNNLSTTEPRNSEPNTDKKSAYNSKTAKDLNNNDATDAIIDSVKEHNSGPKSILKPKSEFDTLDNQNKKSVGISTYVLTPPVPPPARQSSASTNGANKKRILRTRSAVHSASQANPVDSSLPSSPDSIDNATGESSPADSGTADLIKSVRFADQPNNIKEYLPWEAPQHSFLNHARPAMGKSHTFIL